MDVGPSAAPMMPIDAASFKSNPSKAAKANVKNIPNCAAAPNSSILGLDKSGPKSIIAPIPMNKSSGNSSLAIPALKRTSSTPSSVLPLIICVTAPDVGRFARIAPNPIGRSRVGSISLDIASQINIPPMIHIRTISHLISSTFEKISAIFHLFL